MKWNLYIVCAIDSINETHSNDQSLSTESQGVYTIVLFIEMLGPLVNDFDKS